MMHNSNITAFKRALKFKMGESVEDAEMRREALKCLRSNRRRRSELVHIPDSEIRMDLHTIYLEAIGHNKITDAENKGTERIKDKTPWAFLRNKFGGKKLNLLESLRELLQQLGDFSQNLEHQGLIAYRNLHWTDLYESKFGKNALNSLTEKEKKRFEALWELFHAEVIYIINHLLVLKEVFFVPVIMAKKFGFLEHINQDVIFGNLDSLLEISTKFATNLFEMFDVDSVSRFGNSKAIIKAFELFNTSLHPEYHQYCVNYSSARRNLNALSNDLEFKEFIKWSEADTRCNRLHLNDLLVAPVQHLTKYPLLLKAIKSNTTKSSSEFDPLVMVIATVQQSIREIEGELHVLSNIERIQEISSNIVWPILTEMENRALIPEFMKTEIVNQDCDLLFHNPWRVLIKEGYLALTDNIKTELYVILFDDLLLMTKHGRPSHGKSFRSLRWNTHLTESPLSSSPSLSSADATSPKVTKRSSSASSEASSQSYFLFKQPLPLDRVKLYDCEEYLNSGSAYKNAFVLVHHNRFCQNVAVYTFHASGATEKNTWVQQIIKAQKDYNELSFPAEKRTVEHPSMDQQNGVSSPWHPLGTSLDSAYSEHSFSKRVLSSPTLERTEKNTHRRRLFSIPS